jgi:hypothetical protein
MVKFNAEVNVIRNDKDLWAMLTRLRDEVTAHHTDRRDAAMSLHASWAVASENSRTRNYHSNESVIGQYCLLFARAVQTWGRTSPTGSDVGFRWEAEVKCRYLIATLTVAFTDAINAPGRRERTR